MPTYVLLTAVLFAMVVGLIAAIACTALRKAEPAAVPDVLRELVPLVRAFFRRR
ncbi:hypothetical protein ABZ746_23725 [Streptomyces sp. NPDC020096]